MSLETTVPAGGASRARREAPVHRVGADVDEAVRKELAFVLRSTAARPQSEAEISAKLRDRDVDDDTIAAVLAQARKLRAVDDAALAAALVDEGGVRRGYGVARVRKDLRRRALPEPVIEDALRVLEGRDEAAAAAEVARERFASLPTSLPAEAVARRLAGYLARRGYPPALAERVAIEISGLDRSWD